MRVIGWSDASLFWSAVDVAISTSDNEGMPIALIEAQLAGLPVIATNVGSNAEVIMDGQSGIVCARVTAQTDTSELAAATLKLVTAADLRSKMGQAGAVRARSHFSIAQMISAHTAAYDRVLASRR